MYTSIAFETAWPQFAMANLDLLSPSSGTKACRSGQTVSTTLTAKVKTSLFRKMVKISSVQSLDVVICCTYK